MGLVFPDLLTVQVVQRDGGLLNGRYVLALHLRAHSKNDYRLLKITDSKGHVVFSLDDLQMEITRNQEFFPMDYASAITECSPLVTIQLLSDEAVRRAVRARRMYEAVLGVPDDFINELVNAENFSLEPAQQDIELQKKCLQVSVRLVTTQKTW